MPHTFRTRYADQLPRPPRWNSDRLLALASVICGAISVAALFFSWEAVTNDAKVLFYIIFLTMIICAMTAYILLREFKKPYRYADTVYYSHMVNHTIRDFLGLLHAGKSPSLPQHLTEILSNISTCYTLITGHRCRCSLKELTSDFTIETQARDQSSGRHFSEARRVVHKLSDNSDFEALWYGKDGCQRFFLCNNLPARWRDGRYHNSSFVIYGQPKKGPLLKVYNWRLPYKSALVLPIRFVPDYRFWPPAEAEEACPSAGTERESMPRFWGFLCVDAPSSNAFEADRCPEIGAAFAMPCTSCLRKLRPSGSSNRLAWRNAVINPSEYGHRRPPGICERSL